MKVLFVGGTGNISTPISRLYIEQGVDLYLLNRGKRGIVHIPSEFIARYDESYTGSLIGDIINLFESRF